MLEKGKISSQQMAIIMFPVIVATGDLFIPGVTVTHAHRDAWISPIWGSFIGLLCVYMAVHLHKLFPKKTLVQHTERILGLIPGKIVGISFLSIMLQGNGHVVRQYGEFVRTVFLPKTPLLIVIGSMVVVCSFVVLGGLEVIARCAQLFVPIVMLSWVLYFILLIPDMDPGNMLPVMEKGIVPSMLGAIPQGGLFGHYILISFMLPYLTDPDKGMKWGMISVTVSMFTLFSLTISCLFIFGDITSQFAFPVMIAIRYIEMAGFIEHIEAFMMSIWVIGTFLKLSTYYYVFVLGLSQWLKLSDFRAIVFPSGFLIVVYSIWEAPDIQEFVHFLGTLSYFIVATFEIGIPAVLLLIALMQKKLQQFKDGEIG